MFNSYGEHGMLRGEGAKGFTYNSNVHDWSQNILFLI